MRIAILGINQESICHAHSILDGDNSALITIYTEDAEAGFSEIPPEAIILNEVLESISSKWYGLVPEALDRDTPSSTAPLGWSRPWQFAWQRGVQNSSFTPEFQILTR